MRQWNVHAWYVTGILLALLIGTASVQWSTIPKLPELISFAVGLSSLLLAVFTIVQSMNNDASGTLDAVREAASELKGTASEITLAAGEVRSISESLLSSNEENRKAFQHFTEEFKSKSDSGPPISKDALLGRLSFGTGPAFLAALISFEKSKPFQFKDIFRDDDDVNYEMGVLGGLRAANIINYEVKDSVFTITGINGDIPTMKEVIESDVFGDKSKNAERGQAVREFFGQ